MDELAAAKLLKETNQILTEGSKPKLTLAEQIGHIATTELPEDYSVDPSQYSITPTQRSVCALMVRGFSLMAACRQLHVNYAAAHRWKNSSWFEPVCEIERKKWLESAGIDKKVEAFAPLVGPALETLREAMASEDDKIRLAAVGIVFEQFFSDSKKPVGRPRKQTDDPEAPLELSDLRAMADARIAEMTSGVRQQSDNLRVVSNG